MFSLSLRSVTIQVSLCVGTVGVGGAAHGQWSSPFVAPGPDERVSALVMHDDGSGPAMYAAGAFRAVDGLMMNGIARYRDGQWSALVSGSASSAIVGNVAALAVHDGEMIAGGYFANIGGTSSGVARWDGKAWFTMGNAPNARALTEYQGALITGGYRSGHWISAVHRWDGSAWQPLGILGTVVFTLAVYNGELIAGGSLSNLGNVVRWNGASWEALGGGANDDVMALHVYNGELIAAGSFTTAGGVAANGIARWDGHSWQPLGEGLLGNGAALGVQNGVLVVGGTFTAAGGVPADNLAMWNGSEWSAPPGVVRDHVHSSVLALLPLNEGTRSSLIVGGWFNTAGDVCANNIARLEGTRWSRLSECPECVGLSGPVRTLLVHDDGSGEALYVGGRFRCAGSTLVNRIARWNGKSWSSLGSGLQGAPNVINLPLAMAEFDDGTGPALYVGGAFTSAGGTPVAMLAKWDGQTWSEVGGGVIGVVCAMTVFDDGSGPALYVGGSFTSAGGNPMPCLARWDGKAWSNVGGGISGGVVLDMIVWDDGNGPALIVGGNFSQVGSGAGTVFTNSIARWRNGAWSGFGGAGLSGYVRSLAVMPEAQGSSLICAGHNLFPFSSFSSRGLAKWNGANWENISPPTQGANATCFLVHAAMAASCRQLFVHGWFEHPGLLSVWNGDVWREMAGGLDDASGLIWFLNVSGSTSIAMADFATFQDQIHFGGDFTSAGGLPASNLAIWNASDALACAADADNSGVVDVDDLLAVMLQWGPCLTPCEADSTPCGGDGAVDVDDLIAVIINWGPCP